MNLWKMSISLQIGLAIKKSRIILDVSVTEISSTNRRTWIPDSLWIMRSWFFNVRLAGISAIPSNCCRKSVFFKYFSNDSNTSAGTCCDFPWIKANNVDKNCQNSYFTQITYECQQECCNLNVHRQNHKTMSRTESKSSCDRKFWSETSTNAKCVFH